jgi:hypothetical protein
VLGRSKELMQSSRLTALVNLPPTSDRTIILGQVESFTHSGRLANEVNTCGGQVSV